MFRHTRIEEPAIPEVFDVWVDFSSLQRRSLQLRHMYRDAAPPRTPQFMRAGGRQIDGHFQ